MGDEYILLPHRGLKVTPPFFNVLSFFGQMQSARSTLPPLDFALPESPSHSIRVIDSVHEDGPKLVEITPETLLELRRSDLPLRIVPVLEYTLFGNQAYTLLGNSVFSPLPLPNTSAPPLTIHVLASSSGKPVAGAMVIAFVNFAANIGAQNVTDASGSCQLLLGGSNVQIDRIYVEPPSAGYWGMYGNNVTLQNNVQLSLQEVQIGSPDITRHFYSSGSQTDGDQVNVAILDTGIDNTHPDLTHITQGRNTARGDAATDLGDNGLGHGTHVAGIIGARGASHNGLVGLAPGATLYNFRVFGRNRNKTTNYEIVKAMIYAMENGCHIINLSLGNLNQDDAIRDAIADAADRGIIVIAAAGNDGKQPITYPAGYPQAIAVSAFGRKGTYPANAYEASYETSIPQGSDLNDFMASFTNYGQGIFFASPGVGVVSCAVGAGYRPWSGTSMACAMVTGIAARVISKNPATLLMNPDISRHQAFTKLLSSKYVDLGFPLTHQGFGRPA